MPNDNTHFIANLLKQFGKVSTAAAALLAQNTLEAKQTDLASVLSSRVATAIATERSSTNPGLLQKPLVLLAPRTGSHIHLAGHRSHRSHSSHRSHTSGMGASSSRSSDLSQSKSDSGTKSLGVARGGSGTRKARPNESGASSRPQSGTERDNLGAGEDSGIVNSTNRNRTNEINRSQLAGDRNSISTDTSDSNNRRPQPSQKPATDSVTTARKGTPRIQAEADDPALSLTDNSADKDEETNTAANSVIRKPNLGDSKALGNSGNIPTSIGSNSTRDETRPENRFQVLSIGFVDGKPYARIRDAKTSKKLLVGLGETIEKMTVTRMDVDEKIVELTMEGKVFILSSGKQPSGKQR